MFLNFLTHWTTLDLLFDLQSDCNSAPFYGVRMSYVQENQAEDIHLILVPQAQFAVGFTSTTNTEISAPSLGYLTSLISPVDLTPIDLTSTE